MWYVLPPKGFESSALGRCRAEKGDGIKKAGNKNEDLRREYSLSKLEGRVRGKDHQSTKTGTNLVLPEPDEAEAFPNASAVDEALRMLAELASRQPRRVRKRSKKPA